MNKEEMKNKISMALKDPILQQGFECICKENAELEKAYNGTEGLLDKQIEATYKLFEENKELKRQVEQKQHLADVRLEQSLESYKLFSDERKARIDVDIVLDDTTDQLTYAKTIIQDLLDNTDEYARQRAEDFLKENK